jgi:molybdopterin-guanine dinucleotide biosynthesis protein A
VILAGGRGQRLGGAKPLRAVGGRPLIGYPIAAARAAGLHPVIVCKPETDLGPFETDAVTTLREPARPTHPLLGIATALRALDAPVVVCPCDLPLLPAALLADLAGLPRGAVVASGPEAIEPLLGRYEPASVPVLEEAVAADRSARRMIAALDPLLVGTERLSAFGDPASMLANANTADDLAQIERALG